MAAEIPEALKAADISRFALRANQLEKVKPVMSYWCNFHVINQILNRGLHTSSDAAMTYTTTLMDKLETVKTAHSTDDAITDDLAAQAYLSQFALETFTRADNAVAANKVSLQTADTFRAAATFLDIITGTWPTYAGSPELASKSKYAKYHALRIAKAIKAGEDPNASNPPPPQQDSGDINDDDALPPLDPNDPDVQMLNRAAAGDSSIPEPDGNISPVSPQHHPPPSQPPESSLPPPTATTEDAPDVNADYFPSQSAAPSAPSLPPLTSTSPQQPTVAPIADPRNFYADDPAPPPPSAPTARPPNPTPLTAAASSALPHHPSPQPPLPQQQQQQQQQSYTAPQQQQQQQLQTSDEAVAAAQKHARWAISALNFEDVGTAVEELRRALKVLGAG